MKNETYNKLAAIYKDKTNWKNQIDFTGSCLNAGDSKVIGKAIWILGEMGFTFGNLVQPYVKEYIPKLYELAEKDSERVVRIHALGAIKASGLKKEL